MEIKFGKFTKLSRKAASAGSLGRSTRSKTAWPKVMGKALRKTTAVALPWRYRGVADWESFHGGKERKRGPWKEGLKIHLVEQGRRKRGRARW
jgi:hypothetical protein